MRQRLHTLLEAINVALCKLNEILFSAPWKPRAGGC
jgi:hypothetical protein